MCTLRPRVMFLGLLIIALAAASPARAQDTGTISGTVVDTSDQVLPGATLTLTDEATGAVRTMTSNERGEFAFRALQPGSYTIAAELQGFRKYERRANVLNASSRLELGNVKLEIGTLSEVVSVVAEGTVVETRSSDY